MAPVEADIYDPVKKTGLEEKIIVGPLSTKIIDTLIPDIVEVRCNMADRYGMASLDEKNEQSARENLKVRIFKDDNDLEGEEFELERLTVIFQGSQRVEITSKWHSLILKLKHFNPNISPEQPGTVEKTSVLAR